MLLVALHDQCTCSVLDAGMRVVGDMQAPCEIVYNAIDRAEVSVIVSYRFF